MNRSFFAEEAKEAFHNAASSTRISRALSFCAFILLSSVPIFAQVVTVDTSGRITNGTSQGATVDRRYAQITPTHIDLPKDELDPKTRIELERFLQADQGFAMRPF